MIAWTEDTTYSSATDADAYSGTPTATAWWLHEVAAFIANNIGGIEYFAYAHEERDHFNFLFRSMFKERFLLILQVHIRSMFFYRRLMFSISGWLGRKARAKKA